MIPDRLILALAVPFGEPSLDNGERYRAEQFGQFLDLHEMDAPIPMYRDHRTNEVIGAAFRTGWWYAYTLVQSSSVPDGLLALGLFSYSPAGEAWLNEVRSDPGRWSVSMAYKDVSLHEDRSQLYLGETSLTQKPALESARVLGVGPEAASRWELLTGTPVPGLPANGMRVVEDDVVAYVVGNRPYRNSWQEPIWRAAKDGG